MGMMNEFPITSQSSKVEAALLQEAQSPGYFVYVGDGSETTRQFDNRQDRSRGQWDHFSKNIVSIMRSTIFFLSMATTTSSKEISKDQEKTVHFNASDASKEMIFNHMKSSNDLSSLFGIGCVPQDVTKDNGQTLRSRSHRASSNMSSEAFR